MEDQKGVKADRTMRFAYADPPYIGQARKHYSHDPRCAEVNHAELIERLNTFDAWALSLSSPTLKAILAMCPDDVRVGPWVKPFAVFRPNVNPAYCWEPVIFRGCRKQPRKSPKIRDYVAAPCVMNQKIHGTKPDVFCWWVFDMLGAEAEDEFHDLFPGSGAVSRAWDIYKRAKIDLPIFGGVLIQ